ncbi:alpha/beta fold hydrolase [Arenimonas sp.]|uniref:alpha/beta fold hydrolase n=1 Tax=Arenimonas sp. TaxID=1872635 RepID=UPI0039E5BEE8
MHASPSLKTLARALIFVLLPLCLCACLSIGDPKGPIANELIRSPAADSRHSLVIVLPGRGDNLDALRRSGIAGAIQSAWPEADVLLAEVGLAHYMQGRMAQRLHEELIIPARRRGYEQVWLLGASMGGMGTLLYDRQFPGEMDGLVLLAPYLGQAKLLEEVREAGGLAQWQAGPKPDAITADNYQRELWRHLQDRSRPASRPPTQIWLAYGDKDRLGQARPLIEPLLPDGRILVRPGGHAWAVWTPATKEIFARIRNSAPAE